jgi:hypothetical protein
MALDRIDARSENRGILRGKVFGHLTEADDFGRADEGKIRRIKKQDQPSAVVSRQRVIGDRAFQHALSPEIGRFVADPQCIHYFLL